MQVDEEVGKIALSTPLLVCKCFIRRPRLSTPLIRALHPSVDSGLFSCDTVRLMLSPEFMFGPSPVLALCDCVAAKALECFLQDLLNRTYDLMRDRGGKTLSSAHLYVGPPPALSCDGGPWRMCVADETECCPVDAHCELLCHVLRIERTLPWVEWLCETLYTRLPALAGRRVSQANVSGLCRGSKMLEDAPGE